MRERRIIHLSRAFIAVLLLPTLSCAPSDGMGVTREALAAASGPIDLFGPAGFQRNSFAVAINDSGLVVGNGAMNQAFFWTAAGGMVNLHATGTLTDVSSAA